MVEIVENIRHFLAISITQNIGSLQKFVGKMTPESLLLSPNYCTELNKLNTTIFKLKSFSK